MARSVSDTARLTLVGAAALAIFVSPTPLVGCTESFTSCHERRRCPKSEPDGGAGEGGVDAMGAGGIWGGVGGSSGGLTDQAGDAGTATGLGGSNTGGRDDPSAGTSGAAEAGGEGGLSNAVGEPVEVLSVTPEHGATGVERQPEVTFQFSQDIDPESVVAERVVLEGPEGPVDVDLELHNSTIVVRPRRPLALLGVYTATVSSAVTTRAGVSVGSSAASTFTVRDGKFGTTEEIASVDVAVGNAKGDVLLLWRDTPKTTLWGRRYDGVERKWSASVRVSADRDRRFRGIVITRFAPS